jgi:predicted ATP-dependent Lon-type protease
MKALIALLALLLTNPVSAETSISYNQLGALKVQLENAARQFLRNSSEAEVEFRYEQRQSLEQRNFISNKRLHNGKLEQIYCYRIIYRKTADGRLQYEIESRTAINGKLEKLSV